MIPEPGGLLFLDLLKCMVCVVKINIHEMAAELLLRPTEEVDELPNAENTNVDVVLVRKRRLKRDGFTKKFDFRNSLF